MPSRSCRPALTPRAVAALVAITSSSRAQQRDPLFGRFLAAELTDDPELEEHEDAVAQAEHLEEVGRRDDHGHPPFEQLLDEAVDLLLGADVDAPGGLVEQ